MKTEKYLILTSYSLVSSFLIIAKLMAVRVITCNDSLSKYKLYSLRHLFLIRTL